MNIGWVDVNWMHLAQYRFQWTGCIWLSTSTIGLDASGSVQVTLDWVHLAQYKYHWTGCIWLSTGSVDFMNLAQYKYSKLDAFGSIQVEWTGCIWLSTDTSGLDAFGLVQIPVNLMHLA